MLAPFYSIKIVFLGYATYTIFEKSYYFRLIAFLPGGSLLLK
jgi:hypothetical protein